MQREKNVRNKVYTHNIKFRTSNPMDKYIWDWCGNQDQLHSSVVMAIKMAIALYGKGDLPQAVQRRTFMNARNKLNGPQPVQTAPVQGAQVSANSATSQPQTNIQPTIQRPKPQKKVKVQFHQPKQYKQPQVTKAQKQTQQRGTNDESDDKTSKKDVSSLMKQLGSLNKNK